MPAPKGNRYSFDALAYCKTPQHRQDAFKAYCEHVAEGHLKESFTWKSEDGSGRATYRTIRNLREKYAEELPLLLLEEAEAKNLFRWQNYAFGLVDGSVRGEGFVWINNMHNRFRHLGWNISQPKNADEPTEEQKQKEGRLEELGKTINGN